MPTSLPLIRIVDDDPSVCEAQSFFLRLAGWEVKTYPSAVDFLEQDDFNRPGCLILDVRMPQMSGLELQHTMKRQGLDLPIIFMSAHGDIEMAINCVQMGAFNFLVKPPEPDKLQQLVQEAVNKNITDRRQAKYVATLQKQLATLTSAELQVARLVAKGLPNQTIALTLEVSERTVKSHRAIIYEKLDVLNAVELADFLREAGDTP